MSCPPKIIDEKKSDHNFLYPSDRQHKTVPVKIVNPLVNAFSTEISLIFYATSKNLSIKKQRAITQKLNKQELQFICTVPPLHKIYPPTKFHNHSKNSFWDMHRTKLKYESKQRAITQKQLNKSYGSCALHYPLMTSIHPQNFTTIASIVLEICTGQNSSRKMNKGQ